MIPYDVYLFHRFLLMMGVLFCCGAGFFIRRRLHPPQMTDEPPFTVGFTRQPVNTTGCQTTASKYILGVDCALND